MHNVFFSFGYWQRGLLNLLRAEYDTYILAGEIRSLSTWVFLLLRRIFYPHKRVYLWSHGMLGKESVRKVKVIKFFYSLVNGAFIYNNRSRELMIKCGLNDRKLFTIYNSLDYDRQLQLRKLITPTFLYLEHFDNDNKNIVFIGRLTKIKRLELLLEALSNLKNNGIYVNVTFVGDGEERGSLVKMAEGLKISKQVWFYGACYDERVNAEFLFNADLCVSPGNIGLTAMHVMMFGCPVITNDDFNHQMPEFEAIKKGTTGAFFKAGDSISLANSISNWLTNHDKDRDLVRHACYKEIDERWNPHIQIEIIKKTLLRHM